MHAAFEGDFSSLVAWSLLRRHQLSGSLGLFLSVTCAQDVASIDPQEVAATSAGTLLRDYRYRQQRAACAD